MDSYLIIALVMLCVGYFLGRHMGWQEGLAEGKTLAPIELRVDALTQGICPLCQTIFDHEPDCEEFDT